MALDRPKLTTSVPDAGMRDSMSVNSKSATNQDAFAGYSLKEFDSLLNELESQKRQNLKLRSSSLS